MLKSLNILLLCGFAATACGAAPLSGPVLRGASIGPGGYATILDAPPAPFTPIDSGSPPPVTPEQQAAQAQFQRVVQFQNGIRPQAIALADRLRRAEKGNFVDFYYENDGDPKVVYRFLRNGTATLRKYSRNPAFVADSAAYTNAQLQAALDYMMKTFADDRVIQGGGTGNKENRAVIDLNVTEPEFRALVARKGVTIPAAVKLNFRPGPPVASLNPPLPAQLARSVRIFPRDDRPTGIVHSINSRAKVVLDDGCFRLADHDNALALLPLGAQLFIDREGYLAFGSEETPGYARVGEMVIFEGSAVEVTARELVEPLHAACGPGRVIKLNALRSEAAERAQNAITENLWALKQLKESYGLPDDQARKALEGCKRQMGFGVCRVTPPHPVRSNAECPAGTTLRHGLCRTREGYIRPIPDWIAKLLKG